MSGLFPVSGLRSTLAVFPLVVLVSGCATSLPVVNLADRAGAAPVVPSISDRAITVVPASARAALKKVDASTLLADVQSAECKEACGADWAALSPGDSEQDVLLMLGSPASRYEVELRIDYVESAWDYENGGRIVFREAEVFSVHPPA